MKVYYIAFLLGLVATSLTKAQNFGNITYAHAVNISGKQRMLSQRMTKIYLERRSGKTETLNKQYQESLVEFNENFALLEANAIKSNTEVTEAVKAEKKQWEAYLQTFMFDKNASMEVVVEKATELLKICNNLVLAIEKEAKEKINNSNTDNSLVETVNISGKQRMLSQRFAMLYIACTYNKRNGSAQFCDQTEETLNKLVAFRNSLSENNLNTTEISTKLETVNALLNSIDVEKLKNNEIDIKELSILSNTITKTYNEITGLYAKL